MLAHIYKIIFNQLKIDMFAKMNSELDRKFVIYINFFFVKFCHIKDLKMQSCNLHLIFTSCFE